MEFESFWYSHGLPVQAGLAEPDASVEQFATLFSEGVSLRQATILDSITAKAENRGNRQERAFAVDPSLAWSHMDYRNTETKLDQLVGYFNEEKINLSPVFQRGRVWKLNMRKELIKNILRHRPIPAIFLYKDEAGAKYSYNILDGKQRLESIVMFIGGANPELPIKTWAKYIFGAEHRQNVGFAVDLGDKKPKKFVDLDEKMIRDLREYPIPTIEIALNENTSLDEIISLFVDINQYGAKVTRVNIVKALKQKDPLLKDVYKLIAEKQRRQQDVFTRRKKTAFVDVLKKLNIVATVYDAGAQADRMWEKLFELALFVRSGGRHRKPSEILKTFIKSAGDEQPKLSKDERGKLTAAFTFLQKAYKSSELGETRLATDQTHFYILAASLLGSDLLIQFDEQALIKKLVAFGKIIDGKAPMPKNKALNQAIKRYQLRRLFQQQRQRAKFFCSNPQFTRSVLCSVLCSAG